MAALLFLSGVGAGSIGALVGIGGGMILVPLLHLAFGIPLPVAAAVSLCSVIATSSGAAATFAREGRCDVRLGIQLELFTVAGAILGALVAPSLPTAALQLLFGAMTVVAVRSMLQRPAADEGQVAGPVQRLPLGCAVSFGAGALSGALGVGGGAIKVPVMHLAMGVPFKVASATSNFMIGVTAAASVFVYVARGMLDLAVAVPTVLGVLLGAGLGARLMPRLPARGLQWIFAVLMVLVGAEMTARGLGFDWRALR